MTTVSAGAKPAVPASAVLDDMDSRPGSTTSLLRTVIGLYLRRAGGWLATRNLVELMEALDVSGSVTRTALSRLKHKGMLIAGTRSGDPGFTVTPGAAAMLKRGDRRIFNPRSMSAADPWCLVSFSIPETDRGKRHQLRRRLHWIGCGTVAAGLWICPGSLRGEVEEILDDLQLRSMATLFMTGTPLAGGSLRETAAAWWDLDAIAELHRDFIQHHGFIRHDDPALHDDQAQRHRGAAPGGHGAQASAASFAAYVRCIDRWRIIPYLDPGLPADFLPDDWPGAEGTALFRHITAAYAEESAAYVRAVVSAPRP